MVPVRFSCVAVTIASAISLLLHTYFVTLGRGKGDSRERRFSRLQVLYFRQAARVFRNSRDSLSIRSLLRGIASMLARASSLADCFLAKITAAFPRAPDAAVTLARITHRADTLPARVANLRDVGAVPFQELARLLCRQFHFTAFQRLRCRDTEGC
jgi:hypothetical protein